MSTESKHKTPVVIRPGDQATYNRFLIEGAYKNPETGVEEIWVLYVNADVALPKFWSLDDPYGKSTVNAYWDTYSQLGGLCKLSGSLGRDNFYLNTHEGLVFKGHIGGGPEEGQSFTATSAWTKS